MHPSPPEGEWSEGLASAIQRQRARMRARRCRHIARTPHRCGQAARTVYDTSGAEGHDACIVSVLCEGADPVSAVCECVARSNLFIRSLHRGLRARQGLIIAGRYLLGRLHAGIR